LTPEMTGQCACAQTRNFLKTKNAIFQVSGKDFELDEKRGTHPT